MRKHPDLVDYITSERSPGAGDADASNAQAGDVGAAEACRQAASVSDWCASACLAEHDPELTRCIQVCLDSHDILHAAATILSRVGLTDRLATTRSIAFTALVAADECAAECKLHGGRHHHCELCAAACLHAAGSLRTVIESLDALLAASSPNI